jgi:hypothetical protein
MVSGTKPTTLKETHLVTGFAVQQDPSELDYFCRILCDINAMFIAGCRHMNDHVSVKLGHWRGRGCDDCVDSAMDRFGRASGLGGRGATTISSRPTEDYQAT